MPSGTCRSVSWGRSRQADVPKMSVTEEAGSCHAGLSVAETRGVTVELSEGAVHSVRTCEVVDLQRIVDRHASGSGGDGPPIKPGSQKFGSGLVTQQSSKMSLIEERHLRA